MTQIPFRQPVASITGVSLALVAAIATLDWLTPAGVVVGILLTVPIVLSSMAEKPQEVWLVTGAAIGGFVVAAAFGRGPISPAEVWVPNRIFAALTLPASGGLALILQKRRLEARRMAEESRRTSDLNRLLLSLLAHDLRSPLSMALQALDYAEGGGEHGSLDLELVDDVRTRLQRSLGAVDSVLSLARTDVEGKGPPVQILTGSQLARELKAEALAFGREAVARGKQIEIDIASEDNASYAIDALVLRQGLAILVDNAIRHARPGRIGIVGRVDSGGIRLEVADEGPGRPDPTGNDGSGLGLALCRALIARAGGELRVSLGPGGGTTFSLRLPLRGAPHST